MLKGISPLVATVLLIAITMTLAGIVAFWGSSFVRTTLPTENQTQTLQACSICRENDLELFSYYHDTNSGSFDFTIRNKCSTSLTLQQIVFKYSNGATEIKNINTEAPPGITKHNVTNVPPDFINFMITTNCGHISLNVSVGE